MDYFTNVIDIYYHLLCGAPLSKAAREHAIKHYDLPTVCLPKQLEWLNGLAKGKA